jgi:hypothetical protein
LGDDLEAWLTFMTELTGYLDEFVEPTLDEFRRDPFSRRRAYLACVAIYHAIDRHPAHGPRKPDREALREAWRAESEEFAIVEIAAHDFKHVLATSAIADIRPPIRS